MAEFLPEMRTSDLLLGTLAGTVAQGFCDGGPRRRNVMVCGFQSADPEGVMGEGF